jgi:hypothetical protein
MAMRRYVVIVTDASNDTVAERAAFKTKKEAEDYAAMKKAAGYRVNIIPPPN